MKTIVILTLALFSIAFVKAQPCVSPNPNLVLNPGFEFGIPPNGANGPCGAILTNNVTSWLSLFGNAAPFLTQTADYFDNTCATMTQNRFVAMYMGYGGTSATVNFREGIQGRLSNPIQSNSGKYCLSFQIANYTTFSSSTGTIRMVVYGIKLGGNYTVFNNTPLGASNMNMIYPSMTKIPLAQFDISNIGTTPVFLNKTFNANIIPAGSVIDAIIITRSDETSKGVNDFRYILLDEVVLRRI